MINISRFKDFSDDEIYMLSRQAAEASYNIIVDDIRDYSKQERNMHMAIVNELNIERRNRGI